MTSGYTTDQQPPCLSKAAFIIALFQEQKQNCARSLAYHRANREACLKRMATRRAALKAAELAKTPITNAFLTLFFSWCLIKIGDNIWRRKATKKRYKDTHKKKIRRQDKSYRSENREELLARKKKRRDERYATDPNYKLANVLRARLRVALEGKSKADNTLKLLGCSLEFFREYIEKQFQPGMAWENHGPVWELDHILPCAAFHLRHSEEQEICFHWTNFQPLSVADNKTKSDKVL